MVPMFKKGFRNIPSIYKLVNLTMTGELLATISMGEVYPEFPVKGIYQALST